MKRHLVHHFRAMGHLTALRVEYESADAPPPREASSPPSPHLRPDGLPFEYALETHGPSYKSGEGRRTLQRPDPAYVRCESGRLWRVDLLGYHIWNASGQCSRSGILPLWKFLHLCTPTAPDSPLNGARPHGRWRQVTDTHYADGTPVLYDHPIYGVMTISRTDGVHAVAHERPKISWDTRGPTPTLIFHPGGQRREVMLSNLSLQPKPRCHHFARTGARVHDQRPVATTTNFDHCSEELIDTLLAPL